MGIFEDRYGILELVAAQKLGKKSEKVDFTEVAVANRGKKQAENYKIMRQRQDKQFWKNRSFKL